VFVREAVGHHIAGIVFETGGGRAQIGRLALSVLRAAASNLFLEAEAGVASIGRAGIVALAVLYGLGADGVDAVETVGRCSIAGVELVANGVVSAAGGFAGNTDRGFAVPAALRRVPAAAIVPTQRASPARSLETDLALGATVPVADNLARRAAELFAVTFAVAAGVVTALAMRGIAPGDAFVAAGGAAFGQCSRTDALCANPDLSSGAFGNGCWCDRAAGGLGGVLNGAGSDDATQTKKPLEHRTAALPAGK
jgi:hypothetical protein